MVFILDTHRPTRIKITTDSHLVLHLTRNTPIIYSPHSLQHLLIHFFLDFMFNYAPTIMKHNLFTNVMNKLNNNLHFYGISLSLSHLSI